MLALLDKIPEEEKAKGVVICGDLVDRGSRSAQVIQYCIDNNIQVVKGNHEDMMINEGLKEASYFIKNHTFDYRGDSNSIWGVNGGFEALESYITLEEEDGKKTLDMDLLITHIDWIKTLPYYIEFKDIKNEDGKHLLITHTSASKVWKWSEERRKEHLNMFNNHLTWNRDYNPTDIEDVYNVFGHTIIKNGPKIEKHYANIDTGCFHNVGSGYYTLTALQYPEMIVYQHKNIDNEKQIKSAFGEVE